jgi:glycosyltransferase involved in cell wall biosynthesis
LDVSILIPARNEIYLQATIDNILQNMRSDFEVVVGLDGYWPDPPLKNDPRVVIYHVTESIGMKKMINSLARIAKGKYVMKADAHCTYDEGYDTKLLSIVKPGYTVLGIRYELDAEKWERRERTNCDFRYLSPLSDPRGGLRSLAWHEYKQRVKGQKVAETMSISGSGWLMEKEQFLAWGGLYDGPETGTFGQEGCEIACKTWLSGGKLLVNRETWYSHWNRGKHPYKMGANTKKNSIEYSIDYWLNDRWPLQKYSFQWLIDKFAPVPGWESPEIKYLKAPRQGTLYKGLRAKYHKGELDYRVSELWDMRIGLCEPLKRERLKIFYDSFTEVIENLKAGKTYTTEDMEKSRYYQYLVTHLSRSYVGKPPEWGKRHVLRKFKSAIRLFHDIQQNGMKTPLQCYAKDGNLILWRGYRRLVIAKVLGIERLAIVVHVSEKTAKSLPEKFQAPEPGSITKLAEQQFVQHGGWSTDKYWAHGYMELYDFLFKGLRDKRIKLLELGLARGASLRLWHEAFPKGKIYGLDKDAELWKMMAGDLDRIEVFIGKQQDTRFLRKTVMPHGPFDIIMDDCGHNTANQMLSFETLWPSLKSCGFYVIEDCYRSYASGNVGKRCVPRELAKFIDKIYTDYSILSVQYYYNICVIQKGV